METNLAKTNQNDTNIVSVDINGNLPSLQEAKELPLDLCGTYWTPENAGESKRLFFVEIKSQQVLSANGNGELIDLDCAVFLEQKDDGEVQTITNGSRRLVGILEQYAQAGILKKGAPLKITYVGKKQNKSNGFKSDNWSIKPLIINV